MELNKITIHESGTYHQYNGTPLYNKRFHKVLKFHSPGFAPVEDARGAYHIDLQGAAIYPHYYLKTFGFYCGLAAVADEQGWFHIAAEGQPLYAERYSWCGNYQENKCVVKDAQGQFFHIDAQGNRCYPEVYSYVGDFRDGIATAQTKEGLYIHIDTEGTLLHSHKFIDLGVYHKGFACAKDQHGWFHIDLKGEAIYSQRYAMVEPFYNGHARCETKQGAIVQINERGEMVEQLRLPHTTPFQELSGDIVAYWRTQTIKAAVDFNVFDFLPATLPHLSEQTKLDPSSLSRLLRALQELGLLSEVNGIFHGAEKAQYLSAHHPLSLKTAVTHWAQEHYLAWMSLTEALKNNRPMYENKFGKPLFDWLNDDEGRLSVYHESMAAYARHDYEALSQLIEVGEAKNFVDAAGGEGVLLKFVLHRNPGLHGILLECESLVKKLTTPANLRQRMKIMPFDLFQPWPINNSDIITLSRVLHDWNDERSKEILLHAFNALAPKGRLLIIEFLMFENNANGGMLDMNMLVIAGGKERSIADFTHLCHSCGFKYVGKKNQGAYNILEFSK
jgi:hypothetical protein